MSKPVDKDKDKVKPKADQVLSIPIEKMKKAGACADCSIPLLYVPPSGLCIYCYNQRRALSPSRQK